MFKSMRRGRRAARRQWRFRRLTLETVEARRLLAPLWQNPDNAKDVNADGIVTPVDGLFGINRINQVGPGDLPSAPDSPPPYYDTSGDDIHSGVDVLGVFNLLNSDESPPLLTAGLQRDTGPGGSINSDRITADPIISGSAVDPTGVSGVRAEIGGRVLTVGVEPDGRFAIDLGLATDGSSDGEHTVRLTARDGRGNTTDPLAITFTLDTIAPALTTPALTGATDTGSRSDDGVTRETQPVGRVDATAGAVVRMFVDGGEVGSATAASEVQIPLGTLTPGSHTLRATAEDVAGNLRQSSDVPLVIDTSAPSLAISSPTGGATLAAGARLQGAIEGTGSAADFAVYRFDTGPEQPIAANSEGVLDRELQLGELPDGPHTLHVTAQDLAGNQTTESINVQINNTVPLQIAAHAPLDGASEVGVTFNPKVTFTAPIDAASLTADNLSIEYSGRPLAANIVPAEDGRFVWLFPTASLPGSAQLTVTVDGSTIRGRDGTLLDADGDGTPGGTQTFQFTTVSTTPVPGTSLTGLVLDPGPDALPHTADDLPLPGVEVFILGRESDRTFTDSTGRFALDPVPTGNAKVAINGQTAAAPTGLYFPEMVMDANFAAGQANFVMAGMEETYLPRLQQSILETVDAAQGMMITASAAGAPGLTAEQRARLSVDIAPNSLVAADGSKRAAGQIGISTVPPELVRDMLPPGVLQHTFDITIQAPGTANLSTPAAMTFPNVFDAAPGTQLNLLSFDHNTGRLEIEGGMTVSADGLTVSTNPGIGITHPGWHGMTRRGTRIEPPCPTDVDHPVERPPVPHVSMSKTEAQPLSDRFFTSDEGEFALHFENRAAKLFTLAPCHQLNRRATPMVVEITVEGPKTKDDGFLENLESQAFALLPKQQKTIDIRVKDFSKQIKKLNQDILFGASLNIEVTQYGRPNDVLFDQTFYVGRFLDVADDDHDDGVIELMDTVVDEVNGVRRTRPIERRGLQFKMRVDDIGEFFNSAQPDGFDFDPTTVATDLQSTLVVSRPDLVELGRLGLRGDGVIQNYSIDRAKLMQAFADVHAANHANVTQAEKDLIATDQLRGDVADEVIRKTADLMAVLGTGVQRVTVDDDNTVAFDVWHTNDGDADPDSKDAAGVLGTARIVDNEPNNMENVPAVLALRPNINQAEAQFRLSEVLNELPKGRVDIYVDKYFQSDTNLDDADKISNAIAKTVVHELGHNVGLFHTGTGIAVRRGRVAAVESLSRIRGNARVVVNNAYRGFEGTNDYYNGFTLRRFVGNNFEDRTVVDYIGATRTFVLNAPYTAAPNVNSTIIAYKRNIQLASEAADEKKDVLAQGFDLNADRTIKLTKEAFLMAVGQEFTLEDGEKALDYFAEYFNRPGPDLWGDSGGHIHLDLGIAHLGDGRSVQLDDLDLLARAHDRARAHNDSHAHGHEASHETHSHGTHLHTHATDTPARDAIGGVTPDDIPDDENESPAVATGLDALLWVYDAETNGFTTDVDLGFVDVGSSVQRELRLRNLGDLPLNVADLRLTGDLSDVTVSESGPLAVGPGGSATVSLTFAPSEKGAVSGSLLIHSDSTAGVFEIDVAGFGLNPLGGNGFLELANNNLGEAVLSQPAVSHGVELVNADPTRTLEIDGWQFLDDPLQFATTGFPATLDAANPLVLQPGERFEFDVTFAAKRTGIQRGTLELTRNGEVIATQPFIGTGTPAGDTALDFGSDYVLIETPLNPDAVPIRVMSDPGGNFEAFVRADETIRWSTFDPVSGLVSHSYDRTAGSGDVTSLPAAMFHASTSRDGDGDGLADDIEKIIGSSLTSVDTNGDGISDFAAVQRGLNPLAGAALPLGVISAVELDGITEEAVVDAVGGADGSRFGYVATGTGGFATVEISTSGNLTVLGQFAKYGHVTDLDYDRTGRRLVTATVTGIRVFDVTDPGDPVPLANVDLPSGAARVAVADGIAYVASGPTIASVDLDGGWIIDQQSIVGSAMSDIAVTPVGGYVYTASGDGKVQSWQTLGGTLTLASEAELNEGGGKLSLDRGVAYVTNARNDAGGFSTVDISDPENLVKISDVDISPPDRLVEEQIAVSGSGLGVLVGRFNGDGTVHVMNVSDPQNTADLLTEIALPTLPQGVTIADGLALVSAGSGGLAVVNFAPFDTAGEPPTVQVSVPTLDPPNTVNAGQTIPLQLDLADDGLVTNVQVRLGDVFLDDLYRSAPFAPVVSIPSDIAGQSIDIQVAATDGSGNVGFSNILSLNVVADTTAPQVVRTSPAHQDVLVNGPPAVTVILDESLDATQLAASGITFLHLGDDGVVGGGDDSNVTVQNVNARGGDQVVRIQPDSLAAGRYQVTVDPSVVVDRAGNPLAAPLSFQFTVVGGNRATSGFPADVTAHSANVLQEIKFRVPGADASTRLTLPLILNTGATRTASVAPSRIEGDMVFFVVPEEAATGQAEISGDPAGPFLLQIVPTVDDIDMGHDFTFRSLTATLAGSGLIEGGTVYRVGGVLIADTSINSGVNVFSNGTFRTGIRRGLNNVAFSLPITAEQNFGGPVAVTTAGGTSAPFVVGVTEVDHVAASGTPREANVASANVGETITLRGSGFRAVTDVSFAFLDTFRRPTAIALNPETVSPDGTTATFTLPNFLNGVHGIQVLGGSANPQLQIVPTIDRVEHGSDNSVLLYGTGLVDDDGLYQFGTGTTRDDGGAVVIQAFRGEFFARLVVPVGGQGEVTVANQAGTSAPVPWRQFVTEAPQAPRAIDYDPVTKLLYGIAATNVLAIDPATGATVRTIPFTGVGSPLGIDVINQPITLGGTTVPAGSIVLVGRVNSFPGQNILAIDPNDGSPLASVRIVGEADPVAAKFHAARGTFMVWDYEPGPGNTDRRGPRIIEVEPATGAVLNEFATPQLTRPPSGALEIDPDTGNLLLLRVGGIAAEYRVDGTFVGELDFPLRAFTRNELKFGLAHFTDRKFFVTAATTRIVNEVEI